MQNAAVPRSHDELSVAEIKAKAKGHAQRATRGASALHLIRAARSQLALALTQERDADLKGAYAAYIKAASLIQTFMDSAEFKAESQPGKRGVLWKEYQEYMQVRFLLRSDFSRQRRTAERGWQHGTPSHRCREQAQGT